MRIGLIATSRSGSTYFRRFLCNTFGLYDPASWLKKNDYKDIDEQNWATQPHLLKILPHYIPEDQHFGELISKFPCIWLYRKDVLSQFLSHITRLRTKVNHIHYKHERPDIKDGSLIASKEEYDRFMIKLEQFWDIYYTHIHNGHFESLDHILVSQEMVRENPNNIGKVVYVRIFNDHIIDETFSDRSVNCWESDHAQVVAVIELNN